MITTLSSREFNQDTGRAKRAAADGPVIITDRGTPSHVLLSFEEYRRLSNGGKTMVEMLAMPGGDDIDVEFPRFNGPSLRPAELD